MADLLRVDIDGGKYTFVQAEKGNSYVLRYGEPWLDELYAGANCWLSMACEIEALRGEVESLKEKAMYS